MDSESLDAIPKRIRAGETLLVGVDCTYWGLGSGVTLSGPSVASSGGLTTASVAVNTSTFVNDRGGTCAVGKGVTLYVSGAAAGSAYTIKLSVGTTNGQTLCPEISFVGVA